MEMDMRKLEHLLQQAARAERLSKAVLDTLTVGRLQAFAAECRVQAAALATARDPDAGRCCAGSAVIHPDEADRGEHQLETCCR
jgi:hypothetical protein